MTLQEDLSLRKKQVSDILKEKNIDAVLVSADVNCFYLTGEIFGGYCYVTADNDMLLFSRFGNQFSDMEVIKIRKPEEIPDILINSGYNYPEALSLDEESTGASEWLRLKAVFPKSKVVTGAGVLRKARQIKTRTELSYIRKAAAQQIKIFSEIGELYSEGMTDTELSAKLESEYRLAGHSGVFRTFGFHMDSLFGTVLAGENGCVPSPYDFSLGGAGQTKALPLGSNNEIIKKGSSVLIDFCGNYNGYLSDMTRTFSVGRLPEKAYYAHNVAIEIQEEIQGILKEGAYAFEPWQKAENIVKKYGLTDIFMGLDKRARFVGHSLGLEINESPVFTARDNSVIVENMVFASEPKFAVAGVGAVGVEDTFIIGKDKCELITDFPRELADFNKRSSL